MRPTVNVGWYHVSESRAGGLGLFLCGIGIEGSFGGWIVLTMFHIGACDMGDEVGYCFVGGCLGGPLVDGLGEYSSLGESLDELPHVCSVRVRVITDFSKVASLMGIDKHRFDGCCRIPWSIKVGQVEV